MENVLVKTDKFIFPCDLVVIDMSGILGEMIILGRPFLTTIHAQIDVFNGEISFIIGEDRIKFDETSKGHLHDNERITSRWHVCKPVRVFYDDDSGEDCRIWPTCNPDLSFCSGHEAVYGKGKHGMLKQWVCFRDHERRNVNGSCMEFTDFLHVRYRNQKIDDTTRERRYYE
ncbi:hypothetical protein Tco_1049591 [Tanacetum coccineum]